MIIELSFRNRITLARDQRRKQLCDRIIEVIDPAPTGEVLLDEALKLMKSDQQSVASWIDLLSGTFRYCSGGYLSLKLTNNTISLKQEKPGTSGRWDTK